MAVLANLYLKIETVETILKTLKAKNEKGISLTISIADEVNQYGQNLTSYVEQTKEQRESKLKKFYVGNGSVIWTNDIVKVAKKPTTTEQPSNQPSSIQQEDDLPF
jgi:hypothetical protein